MMMIGDEVNILRGLTTAKLAHDDERPIGLIRKRLRLSQIELADRSDVAQGTVSNFFRGRPIRTDHAQRILNTLGAEVAVQTSRGLLPKEDGSSFTSTIEQSLDVLLGRSMPRLRRAPPGGAIPPEAADLVRRDDHLKQLLDRGLREHPVTMRVRGPAQCGKSTIILQVVNEATKDGFLVTVFDRGSMPIDQHGEATEQSFSKLAIAIAMSWGVAPPSDIKERLDLQLFIKNERKRRSDRPALIVIDDVSTMRKSVREAIVDMCRDLHNDRSNLNLSWLLTLEPMSPEVGDWIHRSRGYFAPDEDLRWFNDAEVQQLIDAYPECKISTESKALREFGGQPFLTHVVIEHVSSGMGPDEVVNAAEARSGKFGAHIEAVERAIGPNLLEKLKARHINSDDITAGEQRFLCDLNIGVESHSGLAWASQFYARVIPQEGSGIHVKQASIRSRRRG